MTGTLTFRPGVTSRTFTVPLVNDGESEGDETVLLRLFNASSPAVTGLSNAVLTIVDNDFGPGLVSFSSPAYVANERDGTALLTLTRTNGTAGTISVSITTLNGTALAGQDYVATNGVVTFGNGERVKTFTVRLLANSTPEPAKTFLVNLTSAANALPVVIS